MYAAYKARVMAGQQPRKYGGMGGFQEYSGFRVRQGGEKPARQMEGL